MSQLALDFAIQRDQNLCSVTRTPSGLLVARFGCGCRLCFRMGEDGEVARIGRIDACDGNAAEPARCSTREPLICRLNRASNATVERVRAIARRALTSALSRRHHCAVISPERRSARFSALHAIEALRNPSAVAA